MSGKIFIKCQCFGFGERTFDKWIILWRFCSHINCRIDINFNLMNCNIVQWLYP